MPASVRPILVVGSVALDAVRTPTESADEILGGAADAVCTDPVPRLYDFMAGVDRFRIDPDPDAPYDLLVISDRDDARALGSGLALPSGVPDWLMPIVSIVPAQLFAYHLARARGLDPDAPRNIRKVTLTR